MVTHSSLPSASPRTITEINLTRVLSRLSSTILSPSHSSSYDELLHSQFARVRFAGNLEYARTLLLRLEHDSSTIKIQSRKQAAQGGLAKQRALIKRIGDALREVEKAGDDRWDFAVEEEDEEEEEEEEEEEDDDNEHEDGVGRGEVEAGGVATRKTSKKMKKKKSLLDEYDEPTGNGDAPAGEAEEDGKGKSARSETQQQRAEEPLQNVLRNRLLQSTSNPSSHAGLNATPSDTTAILTTGADTADALPSTTNPTTSTAQLLESASSTQDALTASLLSMAQRLKQSTQSFSTALEADSAHVDRAVEGLDRNVSGLDAAAGRMGFLRRMSEGRGWWGRMMLYAWIGALWVVAILLVGVGPKLRF